jgi:hypothetical protein
MFLIFESLEKHKIDCYEAEGLSLLLNHKWDRSVYVTWLKIRRKILQVSKIKSKDSVYSLLREVFLTRDHLKFIADKIKPGYAKKAQEWVENQELLLKKVRKRVRINKYKPKPLKTDEKVVNQQEEDQHFVSKNSELL